MGGKVGAKWRGTKGRKEWDNCNSIINKIYFEKRENSQCENSPRESRRF